MQTALRGALLDGKVIPGTKNGITARMLMMCKVEASTADLLEKETTGRNTSFWAAEELRARNAFQRALTQAFQDGEQLHFTEAELAGVPEQFKKRFTGPLQRWQKGRFKIPVGREAMNYIVPYCSVSSTRHQLFEANITVSGISRSAWGGPHVGPAMAVIGPAPLLRHNVEGCFELQEEGLTVLRRVGAPLHVVITIGGSRCGKSTICNALLYGRDAGHRGFVTGSSFDPVTTGVDVAAKRLPSGGSLVLLDCEGAFHICGSALSARGFGIVGFLAYHLSSVVVHVTMGSIDERDIEALGHLAATAEGVSEECLRPADSKPELMLLVNGARFELGDAVARRLLQPPEGAGRGCSRSAIAAAFSQHPALEALPCCEHEAYWPKVEALRERILESPAMAQPNGVKASGSQLAERLERLLAELGQGGRAPDPVSAAEHAMRSQHLDPVVEDIAKHFTLTMSSEQAGGLGVAEDWSGAVEQALMDFDRRSAWLALPGSEAPKELLTAVRQRLHARLEGIAEAVCRGRRESAELRRQSAWHRTPTKLERLSDIKDLQKTFGTLKEGVRAQVPHVEPDFSQHQEVWQRRLQDFQGRHRHQLKSWQVTGQEAVEVLVKELQSIEARMPDVVSAAVMLEKARAELEALRLSRQKAVETSSIRLEQCLEELKHACAEETGGHMDMQERVSGDASALGCWQEGWWSWTLGAVGVLALTKKAWTQRLEAAILPPLMNEVDMYFQPARKELFKGIKGEILDLGCGSGQYLPYYMDSREDGAGVTKAVMLEPNTKLQPVLEKNIREAKTKDPGLMLEATASFIQDSRDRP
eukprot:g21714.t1